MKSFQNLPLRSVAIPMSEEEWNLFNNMLNASGRKKGFFLRDLIMEKMRQESLAQTHQTQ